MTPEQTFERLGQRINRAVVRRDRRELTALLDPDGHAIDEKGTVTGLRAWIDLVVDGPLRFQTSASSRMSLTIHGASATEIGTYTGSAILDGKPVRLHNRISVHWVRGKGGWRLFCIHSSAIPPASGGPK